MKNKTQSPKRKESEIEKALSIKADRAYKSYLDAIKEREALYKELKNKDIKIELGSNKNLHSLGF